MPTSDTIRILQARGAQAAPLDAEEWRRIAVSGSRRKKPTLPGLDQRRSCA